MRDDAVERGRAVPLVTCGLIEPMRLLWGTRSTKFAGHTWTQPVVDLDALDRLGPPALATWTRQRLVPKLVVATQTRVIEVVVDEDGAWFPSVPTIAVTADPDRLWAAAAVLSSPAVSAWALGRHAGAALSSDAIRVSARQLLEVPLPVDEDAWRAAIDPLQRAAAADDEPTWSAALAEFGRTMGAAYAVDEAVFDWWFARLPSWTGRRRRPEGHSA